MAWQSAVSGVKQTVWTCTDSLACSLCAVPGLVRLRHTACAVSLLDTGHTESGLAVCSLGVPERGSAGLVLPLALPFSGTDVKMRT